MSRLFEWNDAPDWLRIVAGVASGGLTEAANGVYQHVTSNGNRSWDEGFSKILGNITGAENTEVANSATMEMQKQAQEFNAQEAAKQRGFEAEQAEIARQWQEQMSNTAVQRQTADLQAAGLNPWLAAGGNGASTGSVGIASGSSASSAQGQGINATQSVAQGFNSIISAVAALIRAINS